MTVETLREAAAQTLTAAYADRLLTARYATCPDCCGMLKQLAASTPDRWVASMVTRCTDCGRKWQLKAAIIPVPITEGSTPDGRCGTEAGYKAHRKRGEPACEDCRAAHYDVNTRNGFRRKHRVGV